MKKIIVTGGAGFLGSHLCEQLIQAGNQVVAIDNLLTGSQKNIVSLMTNKNFSFMQMDVCDEEMLKKIKGIEEIYHFASPADPNANSKFSYLAHPFETMLANTTGTWLLCQLAVKNNARLSFASTSEIYGDPEVSPQSETYRGNVSTTGPRSVYDESKRFGETIVTAFVKEKGLDGRITRIFNTYGPKMNPGEGRAVVNFINQAISGEPMTIYGDGKQTRSFCFVDDQIQGQIKAMESKNTKGEVFNIGNPAEISILEFASKIKELSQSTSEIVFSQELPIDDPKQRKPDISKAAKMLEWEPHESLESGLLATIDYFKSLSA
ncbi:GDP-mannose 4,6-dehydratase [Candidatus Curtissbacteria bacterium]|nr:GDP-mannose 4,6-dehydratase [Candidatus Curtissbacteria bacterium]